MAGERSSDVQAYLRLRAMGEATPRCSCRRIANARRSSIPCLRATLAPPFPSASGMAGSGPPPWTPPPAAPSSSTAPRAFESLVLRPSEITLGEAFLAGDIDVEGDLFSVFAVTEHIFHCPQGRRRKFMETLSRIVFEITRWWNHGSPHTVESDRSAISHHYDQPVDFFRPWLGDSLVYSCAYFRSPEDDLATAQANKLELVCRKLRLKPSDRFLDIGCGWGSLVLHAASHHHVEAQGITISQEQAAVAAARIRAAEVAQSCGAELLDYRHAPDRFLAFDKIASLGMFEHVGMKNLPRYFRTVYDLLRPRGLFLNHGIAKTKIAQPTHDPDKALFARSIQSLPQPDSAAPPRPELLVHRQVRLPRRRVGHPLRGPPDRRVRRLRDPRRGEPARALRAHPARLGRRPAEERRPAPQAGLPGHLPHLAALHGGIGRRLPPRRHRRLPDAPQPPRARRQRPSPHPRGLVRPGT